VCVCVSVTISLASNDCLRLYGTGHWQIWYSIRTFGGKLINTISSTLALAVPVEVYLCRGGGAGNLNDNYGAIAMECAKLMHAQFLVHLVHQWPLGLVH